MSNNVPKLRFKGFNDEWKEKELGDFSTKITMKNKGFNVTNIISNSAKNGLISQRDFFDKDIANKNNIDGYYIIEPGDFVYNPRKSNEAPYGPINMFKQKEAGVVSPLYFCFRVNDSVSNLYLEKYFKSDKWYRYIHMNSDQGARHDRVSIKDSEVMKISIKIPILEEQEKIADFFTKLDKIIEKQEEKVRNLENYKKGMMQKIFSKEIRFKDENGEEYHEWEEKKASELFKNISDKNHNCELKVLSVTQERGVMLREDLDIDIKFDLDSVKNYKRVQPGDFIISLRSFQGGFELTHIEGLISPAYTVFNFIDRAKFNAKYFGYIFKSETFIRKLSGLIYGVRDGKAISFSDFSSMKFKYPCLKEQTKIADFLHNIDVILEKEKEKLEELRLWKKGLLQQMFV